MAIHFKWFHNITNNLQSLCGWLAGWLSGWTSYYIDTHFSAQSNFCMHCTFTNVRMWICIYFVFFQFFFPPFSSLGTLYLWTLSHLLFTFRTDCSLNIFSPVTTRCADERTTNCTYYTLGFETIRIGMLMLFLFLVMLLLLLLLLPLMRETVNYSFLWNLLLRLIWFGYPLPI